MSEHSIETQVAIKDAMRRQYDDLWMEFLTPEGLCGLCGQSGYVDTRTRAITPSGQHVGIVQPCLCPNGRYLKGKAL